MRESCIKLHAVVELVNYILLLVILCTIMYVTNKKTFFFLQNRYPIMVRCLNIGKNIGKPIYLSVSRSDHTGLLMAKCMFGNVN